MSFRQETMNAIFMLQVACRNASLPVRDYTFGDDHVLKYLWRPCPWVLFYDGTDDDMVPINPTWIDAVDLITGAGELEFVQGTKETSGTMEVDESMTESFIIPGK